MKKIIVSENVQAYGVNQQLRKWIFKDGRKNVGELSFPCSLNYNTYRATGKCGFCTIHEGLEDAIKSMLSFIQGTVRDAFEVKDEDGYPLDLLVCFEDPIFNTVK